MSAQDRFGPSLRRIREQRGITLEQIAERTNVDAGLWAAMERNDFSRWPSGVSARGFIREYARAIQVDPEATVDEFCRYFPQGDRRREQIVRAKANLLGLPFQGGDELPAGVVDRRQPPADPSRIAHEAMITRRSRLAAACLDMVLALAAGTALARLAGAPVLPAIGGVALICQATGMALFGTTAGAALAALWMRHLAAADLRSTSNTALPRLRGPVRAARS